MPPRAENWAERIARGAAGTDWSKVAASFMAGLQGAAARASEAQAVAEVVQQVAQWQTTLSSNASDKWFEFASDPKPCSVKPKPGQNCRLHALTRCDVCGNPVCLAHARIDFVGNAICFKCVKDAKNKSGPVLEEDVIEALKFFKLKKTAIWEEVALAYKKAALKNHPDRATDAKDRARREQRLKDINAAHAILKKFYDAQKSEAA